MQNIIEQILPLAQSELRWGCVFCKTGAELAVAEKLRRLADIDQAFAVRQIQHRSIQGVRSEHVRIMLPGYVFFRANEAFNVHLLYQQEGILKLLSYGETWALQEDDLRFAQWLYMHGGLVGMSKAYRVGQRVVIESGPLKEMEGVIEKVDRHNRNGLVHIEFNGRLIKVWLAFEYVSEECR